MQPTQPTFSIPNEHPVTITMEAQRWSQVLAALDEAPHRIARPLIDHIIQSMHVQAEASQKAQQQAEEGEQLPKPNGSGEHLPA
jgi:hypothetical protein